MAFSNEETEELYNNSIEPIIYKIGFEPRCLSYIEHNDDLNNRIMNEITNSQLAIADLTFARPSVYYEAGFAERLIPVVYTCRKDHLKPQKHDKYGNFKIHFDLQMKNIIPWTKPNDSLFRKKLFNRLNYLSKPLRTEILVQEKEEQLTTQFKGLSIHARISQLNGVAKKVGINLRFKEVNSAPPFIHWCGMRNRKGIFEIAHVFVSSKFLKSLFVPFRLSLYSTESDIQRIILAEHPRLNKLKIKSKIILCSLEKIPLQRIRDQYPEASIGSLDNMLVFSEFEPKREASFTRTHIPDVHKTFEIHIIDSIPFISNFKKSLSQRLQC